MGSEAHNLPLRNEYKSVSDHDRVQRGIRAGGPLTSPIECPRGKERPMRSKSVLTPIGVAIIVSAVSLSTALAGPPSADKPPKPPKTPTPSPNL